MIDYTLNQVVLKETQVPRILIVDDYSDAAHIFKRGFELLTDFDVAVALSSRQALQYIQQKPVDLLIVDYLLPDMDGVILAAWVQTLYPQTKVILISGSGNIEQHPALHEASIYRVLGKPISFTELCRIATEALQETK